jgi:hypothetical protein
MPRHNGNRVLGKRIQHAQARNEEDLERLAQDLHREWRRQHDQSRRG